MPNAIRYAVYRQDGPSVAVERTPAGFTATQLQEVLPDPRPTYVYRVLAYYANGTFGEAPPVQYISPPMRNPTSLTVQHLGAGNVRLQWQAVPGAVQYRLDGPGLPVTGHHTTDAFHTYLAPWGAGSWKVVALYPGNFADYATGTTAATVIRVEPSHYGQWITKNNGAGALEQVQAPSRLGCKDDWAVVGVKCFGYITPPGEVAPYDAAEAKWLGSPAGDPGLLRWLNVPFKLWDDPTQWPNEAVYGNLGDLGFGRRTACWQGLRPPPSPAFVTVCYAAAHGYGPGQAGFADPSIVTQPATGEGPGFILAMMIVKEATGSVFMAFGPRPPAGPYRQAGAPYPLLPTVTLDNEGAKLVPFACLSCHGGTYNAKTRKVDGAQLLPLDPSLLAFASPAAKAGQEEKIRRINQMIVNSDPTSKVAAYIRGLYANAVNQSGAHALPDYIPQGWAPQSGFYRSVVKPYCSMCHVAAPNHLSFDSWQNFQGNAPLIHASVCKAKTMPHAELQFKAFWTQDTGPIYIPGLLAATLGYPSCQ